MGVTWESQSDQPTPRTSHFCPKMKLIIRDNAEDVTEWAAKYVIKRINAFNPGPGKMFVLGLPTGGTPLGMYKKLVQAHKAGKISFKHVITFNMDEYVGIAEDHPESYHRYMFDNFFKHIDIDPKNAHVLNGNAEDLSGRGHRALHWRHRTRRSYRLQRARVLSGVEDQGEDSGPGHHSRKCEVLRGGHQCCPQASSDCGGGDRDGR